MSAATLKEVVRTTFHTLKSHTEIAAEAADGAGASVWKSERGNRGAGAKRIAYQGDQASAIVAYQGDDGVMRLSCTITTPPPGLFHSNEAATKHAKPANKIGGKNGQGQKPRARHIGPPPGLHAPDKVPGKNAKSLAHVASCMSQKDAHALAAAVVQAYPAERKSVTIEELVQKSAGKYELNEEFWGKWSDLNSMAEATEKEEILEIVENFVGIHRKHVYLFQRLKNTVLRSVDAWSAPDLAALCHAWAQLGFLHEDLCVAIADRLVATISQCNAKELCWLLDAYASTRVPVRAVTEAVTRETLNQVDDFSPEQLCLHASSFARLNLPIAPLFKKIGERLVHFLSAELESEESERMISARDLTLTAYAFSKLGFFQHDVFEMVAVRSIAVARNFTSKDLQMILVAFARAKHFNHDMIQALSAQALRRVAQFNAETLALTLRSLACFGVRDDALLTGVVKQLPHMTHTLRPIDIITTLNSFSALQVSTAGFFSTITPAILERKSLFTQSDWLGALEGYSSLGRRDEDFLAAFSMHLQASRCSIRQLSAMMASCASLSFTKVTEPLAEAVFAKLAIEGGQLPPNAAAQMYSSLVLLGCTDISGAGSPKIQKLLAVLIDHLGNPGTAQKLTVLSCLDLCHASLLAPPPKDYVAHPVPLGDLLERLASQETAFSQEKKLLLKQMSQALELFPWNREALQTTSCFEDLAGEIEVDSGHADLPLAFFSTVSGVRTLRPHSRSQTWMCEGNGNEAQDDSKSRALTDEALEAPPPQPYVKKFFPCGVCAAAEVRDGLLDVSAALRAHGVQHTLVLDNLSAGAFLHALGEDGIPTRFVWGSSVHYATGPGDNRLRLVPAARFHVAAVQAESDAKVVVVPHFSWPKEDDMEAKGRCLLNLFEQPRMPPLHSSLLLPSSYLPPPSVPPPPPPPPKKTCAFQ